MKKLANRANLVRRHLCEKMWTFCQNSIKSTTNHTILENIDHIEGKISKTVIICYKCIYFVLSFHPRSHKLAINSSKSVDSSNQENLVRGHF